MILEPVLTEARHQVDLPASSRGQPIVDDLLDIMHHAVEHPLNIHFDLSAQRKPV